MNFLIVKTATIALSTWAMLSIRPMLPREGSSPPLLTGPELEKANFLTPLMACVLSQSTLLRL